MPGDSEANQFGLLDSIGGDVISEELVVVFPMGGCAGLDRPWRVSRSLLKFGGDHIGFRLLPDRT
jgi:hypothetical protein